ncbi:MAG: gas vesicle structural protein GvpA [Solirubrobacterales bacterium]|nr:gas vesicle structural protein GvpA [Solirubrobacterales bacterium]
MSALGSFPRSGYVSRSNSSGLADVLDVLLDKGLVIDIFLRVSLVGIELLTVDARIVIASVDTYLRFAEAVNRLDIGSSEGEGLPQLIEDMTQDGASSKTKGILEGAKESLFGSSGDEDEDESNGSSGSSSSSSRSRSRSGSGSGSRSRSRSSSSRGRSSG